MGSRRRNPWGAAVPACRVHTATQRSAKPAHLQRCHRVGGRQDGPQGQAVLRAYTEGRQRMSAPTHRLGRRTGRLAAERRRRCTRHCLPAQLSAISAQSPLPLHSTSTHPEREVGAQEQPEAQRDEGEADIGAHDAVARDGEEVPEEVLLLDRQTGIEDDGWQEEAARWKNGGQGRREAAEGGGRCQAGAAGRRACQHPQKPWQPAAPSHAHKEIRRVEGQHVLQHFRVEQLARQQHQRADEQAKQARGAALARKARRCRETVAQSGPHDHQRHQQRCSRTSKRSHEEAWRSKGLAAAAAAAARRLRRRPLCPAPFARHAPVLRVVACLASGWCSESLIVGVRAGLRVKVTYARSGAPRCDKTM